MACTTRSGTLARARLERLRQRRSTGHTLQEMWSGTCNPATVVDDIRCGRLDKPVAFAPSPFDLSPTALPLKFVDPLPM
jgi:hypothetical protein